MPSQRAAFLNTVLCCRRGFHNTLGVDVLPDGIAGVVFNGVNTPGIHLLHSPGMVGRPVLAFVIPVEENNHAGGRFGEAVHPLAPVFEPLYAAYVPRIFGDYAGVNIAAFVGVPDHKAGTPLHTAEKTIQASVRLAAYVPHLGESATETMAPFSV